MKKIYLACPYSHKDPKIRDERFYAVSKKAGEIMQQGYTVFSPISHSHPIDMIFDDPQDHGFWLKQDVHFIDWADEIWVLSLDGWLESYGVQWEIKYAKGQGKEVKII